MKAAAAQMACDFFMEIKPFLGGKPAPSALAWTSHRPVSISETIRSLQNLTSEFTEIRVQCLCRWRKLCGWQSRGRGQQGCTSSRLDKCGRTLAIGAAAGWC